MSTPTPTPRIFTVHDKLDGHLYKIVDIAPAPNPPGPWRLRLRTYTPPTPWDDEDTPAPTEEVITIAGSPDGLAGYLMDIRFDHLAEDEGVIHELWNRLFDHYEPTL